MSWLFRSGCSMRNILIAFIFLAFALTAQAQLYRWTDPNGKVHYTDTPPPTDAKDVEKKKRIRSSGEPEQSSYALEQARKKFPVTVYVSKGCGDPCKLGLDYLKKRGVPYTQKVVSTQKDIDQLTKLAGARKVPVLVVGIDVQAGYAEQGWSDALDSAGYPKASVP